MSFRLKYFIISTLGEEKYAFLSKLSSSLIITRFVNIFSIDIVVRASSFIFLPIYLNLMTREEYGLYGYLVSIIASFVAIMNFGLYVPQIKLFHDFRNDKESGAALFTINISLFIILTIVMCIVYWFDFDILAVRYLFKSNINYLNYRAYVLCSVFVSVFGLMLYSYFLTAEMIRHIQLYNISKFVVVNFIVIAALYITANKDSVLIRLQYALFAETFVLFSFGYSYVKKMVPIISIGILFKSFRIGIPIMLTALLSMLSLSDRYFLEKYSNFETMAVYNLGLTLSNIIAVIMTSFQAVYGPIFFKEKDFRKNIRHANRIAFFAIIVFFLIGAVIVVMTHIMLISGIINKSYNQVILLLPILFLGSIAMALSQIYQNFMVYFEVTHILPLFFIITNIICVILSMLLVPRFGIFGAADAVAISGASSLILNYIFILKREQNNRYV
jgi:O-antigen/teichoic acid export membrane protein